VASIIVQESNGGTVFHKKISAVIVSKELILLLKRLSLSQPIIPTDFMGAGRSGMGLKISNFLLASDDIVMLPANVLNFCVQPVHDH
jgi:hypothetical protein